jgi:hypothetical protein
VAQPAEIGRKRNGRCRAPMQDCGHLLICGRRPYGISRSCLMIR